MLFIGGTGIISSACAQLAVERGVELHLLKRNRTSLRPVPAGVVVHEGDVRDAGSVRAALGDQDFDVVVAWVAFTPEHVQTDVDLFAGRTGQYVCGAREIVEWHDAHPEHKTVDAGMDALMDRLTEAYRPRPL